ncbi:hypothetical protein F5Y02DRAFT_412735 [Annulohypoxylon stygium]|nr:hypothetical protein F5Y02DRAFT_412735 [Annulohypoxylon stygium]
MKAEDQIDLFNELITHFIFILFFFVIFYGLVRVHNIIGIHIESRFFRAEMQWYMNPLVLTITLTLIYYENSTTFEVRRWDTRGGSLTIRLATSDY